MICYEVESAPFFMYFWLPEDHVILLQLSNTLEEISNYQFSLFEV